MRRASDREITMAIGFIGLGNMGFHMARRLLAAGHTVIALDTRKDVLDRMVALGASAAGYPQEVAARVAAAAAGCGGAGRDRRGGTQQRPWRASFRRSLDHRLVDGAADLRPPEGAR